jgi:hypothetical protein
VQRGEDPFEIAAQVVQAAIRMTQQTHGAPDIADRAWLPNGQALILLLGTADPNAQAEMIITLASECRRVLERQPTLVRVRVPCKVFGDVHGQFRDLLLLFAEYGFPSHTAGDVESISCVIVAMMLEAVLVRGMM